MPFTVFSSFVSGKQYRPIKTVVRKVLSLLDLFVVFSFFTIKFDINKWYFV